MHSAKEKECFQVPTLFWNKSCMWVVILWALFQKEPFLFLRLCYWQQILQQMWFTKVPFKKKCFIGIFLCIFLGFVECHFYVQILTFTSLLFPYLSSDPHLVFLRLFAIIVRELQFLLSRNIWCKKLCTGHAHLTGIICAPFYCQQRYQVIAAIIRENGT